MRVRLECGKVGLCIGLCVVQNVAVFRGNCNYGIDFDPYLYSRVYNLICKKMISTLTDKVIYTKPNWVADLGSL